MGAGVFISVARHSDKFFNTESWKRVQKMHSADGLTSERNKTPLVSTASPLSCERSGSADAARCPRHPDTSPVATTSSCEALGAHPKVPWGWWHWVSPHHGTAETRRGQPRVPPATHHLPRHHLQGSAELSCSFLVKPGQLLAIPSTREGKKSGRLKLKASPVFARLLEKKGCR